ncbi:hypothetical protein D3C76_1654890 [compost metagenome]
MYKIHLFIVQEAVAEFLVVDRLLSGFYQIPVHWLPVHRVAAKRPSLPKAKSPVAPLCSPSPTQKSRPRMHLYDGSQGQQLPDF